MVEFYFFYEFTPDSCNNVTILTESINFFTFRVQLS
jgi:hypothetical protein